jgi:hypothetical protein
MSTTVVDHSEPEATAQKVQANQPHASPGLPVDKFAAARSAKKKEKRARHRAKLRRSHANG